MPDETPDSAPGGPGFLDSVKGFGVTFKTMFHKVDTVEYPEQRKPTAPRFHGRHQLNQIGRASCRERVCMLV